MRLEVRTETGPSAWSSTSTAFTQAKYTPFSAQCSTEDAFDSMSRQHAIFYSICGALWEFPMHLVVEGRSLRSNRRRTPATLQEAPLPQRLVAMAGGCWLSTTWCWRSPRRGRSGAQECGSLRPAPWIKDSAHARDAGTKPRPTPQIHSHTVHCRHTTYPRRAQCAESTACMGPSTLAKHVSRNRLPP